MDPLFRPAPPPTPELHWAYQVMKPNARVNAVWIGPVHGLTTHHLGQTKPCLKELSAGDLDCPFCKNHLAKRWRGYAPAVDFGSKQVVFLVGQTTGAVLDRTPRGKRLTFGRGPGDTSPVAVVDYPGIAGNAIDKRFTAGGVYADGVDLLPWLLRLWEIPDLTEWVETCRPLTKKGA